MKQYTFIIGLLFSLNALADNGVGYNPNNRYGGSNQAEQQQQQQSDTLKSSRGGNIVNDMNKSADKVDYLGEATSMLGEGAMSIGMAGLASCILNPSGGEQAKTFRKTELQTESPEGEEESDDCYTQFGLVTAAGLGLRLNGLDAENKADDLRNQGCEVSAEGCNFDGPGDPFNDPNSRQHTVQQDIENLIDEMPNNPGFGYDAETDSITTPGGSSVPVSSARDGSALNQAISMMEGTPDAEKLKKIKKKLNEVNESSKVVSMGFSAPGGGGGSSGGGNNSYQEDDSLDRLLAQMKRRNKRGRHPTAVAAGKVSTYNGGPIGHKMDNIFEMIHRAYDKYTEMGYFYPPGTRLGPNGLPVQRGK